MLDALQQRQVAIWFKEATEPGLANLDPRSRSLDFSGRIVVLYDSTDAESAFVRSGRPGFPPKKSRPAFSRDFCTSLYLGIHCPFSLEKV
jgi:hypothetical protein